MNIFSKIKNPWPVGLVIFFTLFTSYIVGFVVFASRQKMDLVRDDYYDQEIRFQQQIDRVKRSAPILADAAIEYDSKACLVTVSLPSVNQHDISGALTFYRPSDAGMDTNANLDLDVAGHQRLSVRGFRSGLWKVRIQWKSSGQEYFFEKPIVIGQAKSS